MTAPQLLDTTLRDGEQSPGLYFTHEEKLFLARELDSLGVAVIEAGIPRMGAAEQDVLGALTRLNLRADILAWNRLTTDDLEATLRSGVQDAHFSVPTSLCLLERKLGKTEDWVFRQMDEVLIPAVKAGLRVSLGAEDASRTDLPFLRAVFRHAEAMGAVRVRYADTLGVLTPERTAQTIGNLIPGLAVPLDFHGHNDFGLATANAVAAWKAGAQVLSCSLLGLGERAGNTPLEELAGVLHFLEGVLPDLPLLRMKKVSTALSFLSGRPIDAHRPLLGSDIFRHESGIHVDGLLKDTQTYEVFPPEAMGGRRTFSVGKHSGRAALKHAAEDVDLGDQEADAFLADLRGRMAHEKGLDAEALWRRFLEQVRARQRAVR